MKKESDLESVSQQDFKNSPLDCKTPRHNPQVAAELQKPPEYPLVEDSARLNSIPKKVYILHCAIIRRVFLYAVSYLSHRASCEHY